MVFFQKKKKTKKKQNKKSENNINYDFQKAEFEWTFLEKGYLLSSFSWGFFFSSLGGIVATKVGGTNVFGYGLLVTAVFTVATPWLIRFSIVAFTICRIVEGVAEVYQKLSKLVSLKSDYLKVCFYGIGLQLSCSWRYSSLLGTNIWKISTDHIGVRRHGSWTGYCISILWFYGEFIRLGSYIFRHRYSHSILPYFIEILFKKLTSTDAWGRKMSLRSNIRHTSLLSSGNQRTIYFCLMNYTIGYLQDWVVIYKLGSFTGHSRSFARLDYLQGQSHKYITWKTGVSTVRLNWEGHTHSIP